MNVRFNLRFLFLFSIATFAIASARGQACATSERTINPNFLTMTAGSYTANNYSQDGWTGVPSNGGNIYINSSGLELSDNGVTQVLNQSLANVNLKNNGATLTLSIAVNSASPSSTVSSSLDISYNGVTYVSIPNPAGAPISTNLTVSNGATTNITAITVTSSTSLSYNNLVINLPTNIPNNGILTFKFVAATGSAGDFHIKTASFLGCPVIFSGSVLDDKNGLNDGFVNSSGSSPLPTGLYVNLINQNTTTVVASTAVAANGAYSIATTGSAGPQPANGYSLILTNTGTSTSAIAPTNWALIGQSTSDGGSNIGTAGSGSISILPGIPTVDATYYYAIDAVPTATVVNKGPYSASQFPLVDLAGYRGIISNDGNAAPLSGSDLEDGLLGIGNSFKIASILNGTRLYYGSTPISTNELSVGSTINNYTPSLLRMYGPLTSKGVSFTYQSMDAASVLSPAQSYTIFSAFALPVVLDNFSVKLYNGIATLAWEGVTEINFDTYTVEVSTDSKIFTAVTNIKGAGSGSNYTYSYNVKDEQTYFRLKMTDVDGTIRYSNILSVANNPLSTTILLYPNPVVSTFTLNNLPEGAKQISIVDINGRYLQKYQTTAALYQIDASQLPSGTYFVTVQQGKDNKVSYLKFIKK